MGIFDAFTNDSAEEAAAKNQALYQAYGQQANSLFDTYGTGSGEALDSGLSGSIGALDTGLTSSADALKGGLQTANDWGRGAADAYAPLSDLGKKYGGATSLALDALGVNGAGGTGRAQSAFTTGPGYQFAVDQATDAAARKGASLGLAGSGNTLDAIRDKAQGVASQEYGSWLDRLLGFTDPELSATSGAASGISGAYKNLSDLNYKGGTDQAGLYSSDAAARAGLYTGDAANRVGVLGNVTQGKAGVNRDVTTGQATANNAEAQAAQNSSSAFWSGLMNLGGTAAKGFWGGK